MSHPAGRGTGTLQERHVSHVARRATRVACRGSRGARRARVARSRRERVFFEAPPSCTIGAKKRHVSCGRRRDATRERHVSRVGERARGRGEARVARAAGERWGLFEPPPDRGISVARDTARRGAVRRGRRPAGAPRGDPRSGRPQRRRNRSCSWLMKGRPRRLYSRREAVGRTFLLGDFSSAARGQPRSENVARDTLARSAHAGRFAAPRRYSPCSRGDAAAGSSYMIW